jgi:antitoxin component YwqK of YwqJK toxin-antitoxin module
LHGQTDTLYNATCLGGIWTKIIRHKIKRNDYYYTLYYRNGQKHSEGKARMQRGLFEIGEWHEYDTTGKLVRINEYNRKGRLKKFTMWDNSGKQINQRIRNPLFRRKTRYWQNK